jgi:hypothetical protein
MSDKGVFKKDAPSLTDEEALAAYKDLVRTYPKVVRNQQDPPLPLHLRQNIANVSFKLLKEPKDGIYGLFIVRGTWENDEDATKDAERIIKNVDSTVPIHQVPVGYWGLITNNEKYTQDQLDVKSSEQEITLRDRIAKEQRLKNERQQQELRDQKKKLEDKSSDNDDDESSLNYYTKKRVAERELFGYITSQEETLEVRKKSLKKIRRDLEELNAKYPEHDSKWLENYNQARTRAGLTRLTEDDIAKIPNVGPIM